MTRRREAQPDAAAWLTERAALALLSISRSSFRRLRARHEIKTYRIRNSTIIRFRRADLEALMIPDGEEGNGAGPRSE
jgi:hypothetical protein